MQKWCFVLAAFFMMTSCLTNKKVIKEQKDLFDKENLIPWSIVGFDIKERNPKERLEMLSRLGYTDYGYGHRTRHIPTMEKEWRLAKEKGVTVHNVWLYINLDKDQPDSLRAQNEVVFENIKKVGLQTQIWVGLDPKCFENKTDKEAFSKALNMIAYLAERAKKSNCKIALYNHGGWYGKTENQLRIIKALPDYTIGVVYNFHHAHDDLHLYSETIKNLLTYLWCVNLNGMKKDGPKIITIGQGDLEREMIQQLLDMGYTGPWGVLGHIKGGDPEIILEANYRGLQKLFLE